MRIHFGCAARYVDGRNACAGQNLKASGDRLAGHDFTPFRPGIDMAMTARLITQLPEIDLEHFDSRGPHWMEAVPRQHLLKMRLPREGFTLQNSPLFFDNR
jgi:hypothetical protein